MNASADPSKSRVDKIRRYLAGSGRALGFMLIALGAVVVYQKLANPYGEFDPPGDAVLYAIGLIGGGIFLLRDDPTVKAGRVTDESVPETATTARAKAPRARSPLTLFTLSAAFVAVGVSIALGNLRILTLSIGQLTALALMVVGTGLIAGAWWGRARWLIPIGAMLIPVVMVTSYIDMPPRGQVGSIYLRPSSEVELASRYNLLFGNLNLDLTRLKRVTGTEFVNVNVAAGNVTVYVPERVTLRVAGHIEWGNSTVGRGYESGEDLTFFQRFEGKRGAGTLDLDINGGITSLYVERISHRERFGRRDSGPRARPQKDENRARRERGRQEARGRDRKEQGGRAARDRRDGNRRDRRDDRGVGRGKSGDRHGRRSDRG